MQTPRYMAARKSLIALQTAWRRFSATKAFATTKRAAVLIQSVYKGHRQLMAFQQAKQASVRIQAWFRSVAAASAYKAARARLVKLQAVWRGHSMQSKYQRTLAGIKLLQRMARGMLVRRMVARQHAAATKVQARFRVFAQANRLVPLIILWTSFYCASLGWMFDSLRSRESLALCAVWTSRLQVDQAVACVEVQGCVCSAACERP